MHRPNHHHAYNLLFGHEIGLVYPDNEIEVSSEKLSFPMTFRMKVFSDLTFLLNL